MARRHPWLAEVQRIPDTRGHDEPVRAVGFRKEIEVLGDRRVLAERHTVLPQVTRTNLSGDDFERPSLRAGPRRQAQSQPSTALRWRFPACNGDALPRTLPRGRRGRALRSVRARELKHSRLHAGVGFDLQRVIVRPRNAQASGLAHDGWCGIALTLFAGSFVAHGIPGVCDLAGCRIQRNVGVVAFRWRDHPPSPVFANDRDPVAGEIHWSGRAWGWWRPSAA